MKKFCVFIIACVITPTLTDAQYSVNKKKYDFRGYEYQDSDPYHPGEVFAASLIPGLGQMVSGEEDRGSLFMIGWLGSWTLVITGFVVYSSWLNECDAELGHSTRGSEYCQTTNAEEVTLTMMLTGLIGIPTFRIWSMFDAQRVCKVNNLAWRDQQTTYLNIKLQPYISPSQVYPNQVQTGLSLKFSF